MEKDTEFKLLENGEKLFAKKGYAKTPVQDITEAAGVAKGTFYTYFKSKEDFLIRIYEEKMREFKESEPEIKLDNLDFRSYAIAKTIHYLNFAIKNKKFFRIMIDLEREQQRIGTDFKKTHEEFFYKSMKEQIEKFRYFIDKDKVKFNYEDRIPEIMIMYNMLRNVYIYRRIIAEDETKKMNKKLFGEFFENKSQEFDTKKEAEFLVDLFLYGAFNN